MPNNLYIIGTMNIADRSLALVDLALRRRFAFVDLEPRSEHHGKRGAKARGLDPQVVCNDRGSDRGAQRLEIASGFTWPAVSRRSHYVTPDPEERVPDGRVWFRSRVETEIGPLLDEYWYDAPDTAKKARG